MKIPSHVKDIIRYNNSRKNRYEVLAALDKKFRDSQRVIDEEEGYKNLLYFSLGNNLKYIDLLESCLSSLQDFEINYDILFICSLDWKNKIKRTSQVKKFNIKFLIIEDTKDGVEIAKNRLKVFEYENINEYNNILYLDSDILAIRSLQNLFNLNLKKEKLYVAMDERTNLKEHDSIIYGIGGLNKKTHEIFKINDQSPFNSGQFLFKNSSRMKVHFENVCWLAQHWPGMYFTDQVFMCHYFCYYDLCEQETLNKKTKIIDIQFYNDFRINDETIVHFIGKCQNPNAKIEFMKKYQNYINKLQKNKELI